MAVAFDAFTANAAQTADFNFNHTPVGTPKGVIVWLVQTGSGADQMAGVTYGGTAMTAVSGSPNLLAAGETGAVYCYFLGSSIPTGTQSVSVDMTGSASKIAYCVTLTAATSSTAVQDSDGTINSTSQLNPSITLSLGGNTCWCGLALHSGQNAVTGITPSLSWTSRSETDRGATCSACYTYDTIGTADVAAGWTQTADDACAVCVAIKEQTNQNLERALATETVSISEDLTRLYGASRALSTETVTSTEDTQRLLGASRSLATETVVSSENIARVFDGTRALTAETTTIGEDLQRVYGVVRPLTTETVVVSEDLGRLYAATRTLDTETVTSSENLARRFDGTRALATETTVIGESLTTLLTLVRALATETVVIGESLTRVFDGIRSLPETVVIGESLTRIYNAMRSLSDTTIIGESLTRVYNAIRTLSDTTVIDETLNRLYGAVRLIGTQTVVISDLIDTLFTPGGGGGTNFNRPLATETVVISENLTRMFNGVRTLSETTVISDAIDRVVTPLTEPIITFFTGAGASLNRKMMRFRLKRYDFGLKKRDFTK